MKVKSYSNILKLASVYGGWDLRVLEKFYLLLLLFFNIVLMWKIVGTSEASVTQCMGSFYELEKNQLNILYLM